MPKTAFIGVGSNLGEKLKNCLKAIEMLDRIPDCRVLDRSDFYQTAPMGVEGHDWYINAVVSLEANISSNQLLESILAIEKEMGRERKKKWDPRLIDLDILLFGSDVLNDANLTVPHPLMHLRKFVLVPMCQLAPSLLHPTLDVTMAELLDNLSEEDQPVTILKEAP